MKTWLFQADNGIEKALVLVRAITKAQARQKLIPIARGFGFPEWEQTHLDESSADELLTHHTLNTLYTADARTGQHPN